MEYNLSKQYDLVLIIGTSLSKDVSGARKLVKEVVSRKRKNSKIMWINPWLPGDDIKRLLGDDAVFLPYKADVLFSDVSLLNNLFQ